jgi:hypothetical protein
MKKEEEEDIVDEQINSRKKIPQSVMRLKKIK